MDSANGSIPVLHPDRASDGYLTYCIVSGVFTLLTIISVVLRFIQRHRTRDFWWDDWIILLSLIFSIGVFVTNILITLPGIGAAGYHIYQYTLPQLHTWAKLCLAAEVLYNLSVSLSKISALLFYRRIFSIDGQFLIFMRIMLFLITGQTFACVFGLIFSYSPVEAQWNIELPHTTINTTAFYIAAAVINILLDIATLSIAQAKVWQLHLDTKRKFLLSLVFLLGALTIIASILRIVYLETVDLSDSTYTLTTAGIWTNVEMFLLIICACLPIIYSLFRSHFANGTASKSAGSSTKGPGKNSSSVVTFGSKPTRFKRTIHDDEVEMYGRGAGYHVICESHVEGDREAYDMQPLDPVRVRTEYSVFN